MNPSAKSQRFVYPTRGVCPREIHFDIKGGILEAVRFVGGGCPGNARLVARLLAGRPVVEVMDVIRGIDCRNQTSCPDQLAAALEAAESGRLETAESFRVVTDDSARQRVGLVGELGGRVAVLQELIPALTREGVETIYCLGNLTGNSGDNKALMKAIGRQGILAIQGKRDWQFAQGTEPPGFAGMGADQRDQLLTLPQVLRFNLGPRQGTAFFGDFILQLPGFSDFEPYALEMNMVCGLTDFMADETVFPALEAMTPQFQTDIVVFSQPQKWGHWRVGGKDFISVGPAEDGNQICWGLLETRGQTLKFETRQIKEAKWLSPS